ncbi:ATP-binding protein [Streptomyces sp. Root369]|uniref:ATP-binding protein n=1 Tax=Streptomyces sp. Root369 TaxID=1736523 RepID=UPI000A711D18|nr:ATP-binding protein [Streptomyces sp. Root369]
MTSPDTPPTEETSAGAVTTFDAFARFAATAPPTPPQPGQAPRSLEQRLAYHSQFVTVRTPAIETLTPQVRTLMILGRHQQMTARPSLIVTGPATTGKTTALLQVGRTCHLAHTRGAAPGDDSVPVAYVLVPPGATAKTLAGEFARYLGIPVTARMTTAQITGAVCHTYTAARIKHVLIDEIHRLNPRTSTGAEAADWLKDLTERIPATFVYAGNDVTASAVFTGARGAQLAGRASLIDCLALPARAGEREPFRELITALEQALDLTSHRPGTLPRLAPYLHERTAGRIGSRARLIRQAAIEAILGHSERITKTLLDTITLDHLAKSTTGPAPPNAVPGPLIGDRPHHTQAIATAASRHHATTRTRPAAHTAAARPGHRLLPPALRRPAGTGTYRRANHPAQNRRPTQLTAQHQTASSAHVSSGAGHSASRKPPPPNEPTAQYS